MSDDEDYNSASDIDYVPSEGEQVSEEEGSGQEEDLNGLKKSVGTEKINLQSPKKRNKTNLPGLSRKRRGGIKLEEAEEKESLENESSPSSDIAKCIAKDVEDKKEVQEKKKADNIWASFLSDVGQQPKRTPASKGLVSPARLSEPESSQSPVTKKTLPAVSTPQKMTITNVYNFAGEEIKVSKEVDLNSKEAQDELQKLQDNKVKSDTCPGKPSVTQSMESRVSPGMSGLGVKRFSGGLGGVLSKINKKPKMGTLDKSKLDWDIFKRDEGIDEELKIHNRGKEGYIERLNFLSRTDHREFEIEKNLRLGSSKR